MQIVHTSKSVESMGKHTIVQIMIVRIIQDVRISEGQIIWATLHCQNNVHTYFWSWSMVFFHHYSKLLNTSLHKGYLLAVSCTIFLVIWKYRQISLPSQQMILQVQYKFNCMTLVIPLKPVKWRYLKYYTHKNWSSSHAHYFGNIRYLYE